MKKTLVLYIFIFSLGLVQAQNPEKIADVSNEMLVRAKQFKNAIATTNGYRSGVYVYQKRTIEDYRKNPEQLAARLAILGFTDIYLGVGKMLDEGNVDDEKWIFNFNSTAHKFGMKVHVAGLSSSKLWVDNNRIIDDCNSIVNFNYTNKKASRFDGVTADLEPHIMKKTFVERPKEMLLEWHGTDNFGIGKDNDLLCKRMVEVIGKAKKELGKEFELSQAQGFFIQGRYDKGDLSWGSAQQLLKSCNWLVVMAYNYKPQRVLEMARPSLENASGSPKSISVAIKTSLDTYGSEGPVTSFQPQGWDYLINGLTYLIENGSKYTAFRGIDIFEFQGFEKMWNGTAIEDKRTNFQKPTEN